MSTNPEEILYKNYWQRKELLSSQTPGFPTLKHWLSEELNPTEEHIFSHIGEAKRLLDFGAGNLTIKNKFIKRGFKGEYLSLDHGQEFQHDYKNLQEVQGLFDGILFLDVIEHLPLEEGLELLVSLLEKLSPGGKLILQTPNGRCIRNQLATDMTHKHIYNLKDLWAFSEAMGFPSKGYRVVFHPKKNNLKNRILGFGSKWVTTYLLGCDYADNILLICKKPSA